MDVPLSSLPAVVYDSDAFAQFLASSAVQREATSDLDRYLADPLFPTAADFDILGWWKLQERQCPTIARMARDILCIPASTVASESVSCFILENVVNPANLIFAYHSGIQCGGPDTGRLPQLIKARDH